MREILFRGKQVSNGKWVYGSYVECAYLPEIAMSPCIVTFPGSPDNYHEVYASTVDQYTGLKYKNGTRAFEHDCIRELHGDAIGVIRYGKYRNPFNDGGFSGHIGFYVDWVSGATKDIFRKDLGFWLNRVEVIGNIHDNPELLKGDSMK